MTYSFQLKLILLVMTGKESTHRKICIHLNLKTKHRKNKQTKKPKPKPTNRPNKQKKPPPKPTGSPFACSVTLHFKAFQIFAVLESVSCRREKKCIRRKNISTYCKSIGAMVTSKWYHHTEAEIPGLSRDTDFTDLQRNGQEYLQWAVSKTMREVWRYLGEAISTYKLLSLQGLQHLPKFHTEVASHRRFEFENSNVFCWRLLKDTIIF